MFALFETLLRPTNSPEHPEPPAGLIAFFWHFARQAKWLFVALFVVELFVALTDSAVWQCRVCKHMVHACIRKFQHKEWVQCDISLSLPPPQCSARLMRATAPEMLGEQSRYWTARSHPYSSTQS